MLDPPDSDGSRGRPALGRAAILQWAVLALSIGFLAYRWLAPADTALPPATAPTVTAGMPGPLQHGPPPKITAPSRHAPAAEQALAGLVAERLAELALAPKTAVTPSDLALETAIAIKRGDYATARQIAARVLAQSQMQSWRFYPFNEYVGGVARGDDSVLLDHLNRWLEEEPDCSLAYLLRAAYYQEVAWAARGSEAARRVPRPLMQLFVHDMDLARADAQKSIALDPKIPLSYYELLAAVSSSGDSPDVERAFQSGVAAFPNYYPLYKRRLGSLTPKWGGSIDAMNKFVDRYAGAVPSHSPLKLLYLDLYSLVLDDVAGDCRSYSGGIRKICVRLLFRFRSRSDLEEGMVTALNLSKESDPGQFSAAVWPLLETISCNQCIGSPEPGGHVLQLAASAMGSDNQIMDEPTHNSYMLDDITARVWAQMGNPSNADRKFHEALSDVAASAFSNEAERAQAQATIFDHMAEFADETSQFIDIIVYHDAANAVAGINHTAIPYRKCYAYYRLKHFEEAVKECTALIESNGNYLQTHYWRGKAYEGAGDWDASIADFSPVAESASNWFRVGAALDISYDFGQKGDFAGQLASMNQYPYLFDVRLQPPHDLAVAYNNRCFAEMKLEMLQKALDDCTTSLKFDRIPDAYHKQQQLLQMLGTKTST